MLSKFVNLDKSKSIQLLKMTSFKYLLHLILCNWCKIFVYLFCGTFYVLEEVASNKSSLLLKLQKLNTQTLKLFTGLIKTEMYLQKLLKCHAARLGCRDLWV